MKKILLFIALITVVISVGSCSKEDKNVTPTPTPTPTPTLDVRVDGLYDFAIGYDVTNYEFETKTLPLAISQLTGSQEKITLSLDSLPKGVEITFSTTSGIPNFTSTMTVDLTKEAESGIYPVKLIAKNAAGISKTYNFSITVTIPCGFKYEGPAYQAQETIDGVAQSPYTTYFSTAGPGLIYLYDIKKYFYYTLDCSTKTFTMNQYYVNGNPMSGTIAGTGKEVANVITINGTLTSATGGPTKTVKIVYTKL